MMKFQRAAFRELPQSRKKMIREYIALGITKRDAAKLIRDLRNDEVWINDEFTVTIRRNIDNGFGCDMLELSIKHNDKSPIMDWRKIQQIKNELVGEECDGFQIFPAESRLVDTANQYWFYFFTDTNVRIPVGFDARMVTDDDCVTGAVQRPLEDAG